MVVVRIAPKVGALPMLFTYQCIDCKEIETIESD